MMQDLREYCYDLGYSSAYGFWCGWLGGSTILAGGKIWTLITNSEVKVSQLLGHIGTPSFRRELAVGITVYIFTIAIFELLSEKADIDLEITFLPTAVAIALASLAASKLTHRYYHYVLYPMCVLSIGIIANEIFNQ